MAQLIVNVFFNVLNFIANLFLGPVFSLASSLIPSLGEFFTKVTSFFELVFTYISFLVKLLMIPPGLLTAVAALSITIFTFNLSIRVYGLVLGIYRYFKL